MVSWAAQYNIIGIDPQLIDPENGDYRVYPGTAAEEYGCQIFPADLRYQEGNSSLSSTIFGENNARNSITISGVIETNAIWDVDTVKVVGDIEIADGVTLTIAGGTRVEFMGFYSISVQGCILALGESQEQILFTSKNPEFFSFDHTTIGAWAGIKFIHTSPLNQTSVFTNCIFEYSKSILGTKKGGAISVYNVSRLKIISSIFRNNFADYGGAISFEYQSAPIIFGNLFRKNYAFLGGSPVYCSYSYPKITNNTITGNVVLNEDTFYKTGAIQTFISKPKIINNIIWGNNSNYYEPFQLVWCKGFYTNYNDIEFGNDGSGNIETDPLFFGSGSYPFSLQESSPCINSGIVDTTDLFIYPEDLAGNNRIYENQIDMGAYEWNGYAISEPEYPASEIEVSNYPNPFCSSTTISFNLATNSHEGARIIIYNIKGQLVKTLECINRVNAKTARSFYSITWNGKDSNNQSVAPGIYFYKINAGDKTVCKKMILMR
ncbi:MAG: T9SS type A sorting domain-containing protein [Candidatus Cloacimonadota bacterium]|nr:T9SS type A sorting domain-containing protein [Candidatus Cloacimonadota bacterium]